MKNKLVVMFRLRMAFTLTPFVNLELNAKETNCANYGLHADKTEVTAGKEIKFTLDYSLNSECISQSGDNSQVEIDYSPLVSSSEQVEASYDKSIFDIETSDSGFTTINYNQDELENDSVDSINGEIVFTLDIDNDISGLKNISSNIASDITVNVLPQTMYDNTNMWSNSSYAREGDDLQFFIRVNTDANNVKKFESTYNIPDGLEYIDGSFKSQNSHYNSESDMFEIDNQGDKLVFTNKQPFSEMKIIKFKMHVTEDFNTYKITSETSYILDDCTHIINDDVYTHSFDFGGFSHIEFLRNIAQPIFRYFR